MHKGNQAGADRRSGRVVMLAMLLLGTVVSLGSDGSQAVAGSVLNVPDSYPSIQAAVDAAETGDTIVVAPGTYVENVSISGKSITLASRYPATGDLNAITDTIIDGNDGEYVVFIDPTASGTVITGLTLRNAEDGVKVEGTIDFVSNLVHDTGDALDFQRGDVDVPTGGLVTDNILEGNFDDAIDLDNAVELTVRNNIIRSNRDGGIEVRFDDYNGPVLQIVIEGNTITDNRENGIQLIDVNSETDRTVRIERNVIAANDDVGIGTMPNGNTMEAFTGGDLEELVVIVNNTIVDNTYGITAGDNMAIVNNIISGNAVAGVKRARVESIAAHNLLWNNGTDYEDVIVAAASTIVADPLLNTAYVPAPASPAIDSGSAAFTFAGADIIGQTPDGYSGAAPDLGVFEFNWETTARFVDVPVTHTFFSNVQWLAIERITLGCNPPTNNQFCPDDFVTRGQMAAFLVRGLNLTADTGTDRFVDDNQSVFEADIDKLAAAGITLGCNPPTNNQFCPDDFVTRGQMAAFLYRGLAP